MDGLEQLLTKYHSVISFPGDPLGSTSAIKHEIPLRDDATPVYIPAYRHSHAHKTFCISGTPLTFQRLINLLFSELLVDSVFAFLDDVIIASKGVETHLQKLEEVLNRLKSAGLSLKLTTYNFMKKQIAFLGHVLDSQ